MKKGGKIVAIILAIVAALSAAGVGILGGMSSNVESVERKDRDVYDYRDDSSKDKQEIPARPPVVNTGDDDACYYGCPNSKRVKKLRLGKKRA